MADSPLSHTDHSPAHSGKPRWSRRVKVTRPRRRLNLPLPSPLCHLDPGESAGGRTSAAGDGLAKQAIRMRSGTTRTACNVSAITKAALAPAWDDLIGSKIAVLFSLFVCLFMNQRIFFGGGGRIWTMRCGALSTNRKWKSNEFVYAWPERYARERKRLDPGGSCRV